MGTNKGADKMSCNIREYKPIYKDGFPDSANMILTAFVGAEGNRYCIQFTIGYSYCTLGEAELKDLIETIKKRFMGEEGYTATGEERDDILFEVKK